MKEVCVIIPQYGHEEYTKKCIELTIKNAGIPINILIVDDGSIIPFKWSHLPYSDVSVEILRLNVNSGFSKAVNAGIIQCGNLYKYLVVLNNDTEPRHNFIKELYDEFEKDERIGIASSIRYYDRPGDYNVELHGADLLMGFQLVTNCDPEETVIDCTWVPFCSVMLRSSMLRRIGILDDRMVNHSSDNDLCCRAVINDWRVIVVTKSKVFHYHEVTTSKIPSISEQMGKDMQVFLKKLSGLDYKEIMAKLPLDYSKNIWGDIEFKVLEGKKQ